MSRFLGEYSCKMDAKGRIVLPSGLTKKIEETGSRRLYLNRGFEKCLTIYPAEEFEQIMQQVENLSMYKAKSRTFVRYFMRGVHELELDKANRLRLPERHCEYALMQKEVLVVGHLSRIELWSPEEYDKVLSDEPEEFSKLAEEVMAGVINMDLKGFSTN